MKNSFWDIVIFFSSLQGALLVVNPTALYSWLLSKLVVSNTSRIKQYGTPCFRPHVHIQLTHSHWGKKTSKCQVTLLLSGHCDTSSLAYFPQPMLFFSSLCVPSPSRSLSIHPLGYPGGFARAEAYTTGQGQSVMSQVGQSSSSF